MGNLISDAQLAALAIAHGLTLCSAEPDVARFEEIQWIDPLARRRTPGVSATAGPPGMC